MAHIHVLLVVQAPCNVVDVPERHMELLVGLLRMATATEPIPIDL